jgi:hypothetical protein
MREIAHNWISSVRIKVNASRIAAATASAAQSEDRSANQKTTFFDSIDPERTRTLRPEPSQRSPWARGSDSDSGNPGSDQGRMNSDMLKGFMPEQQRASRVVAAVKAVSAQTGRGMAQVALAWLRYRPLPVIPIIGARKLSQLQDNLASFDLSLSTEQVQALDEASQIDLGFPYSLYGKELFHRSCDRTRRDVNVIVVLALPNPPDAGGELLVRGASRNPDSSRRSLKGIAVLTRRYPYSARISARAVRVGSRWSSTTRRIACGTRSRRRFCRPGLSLLMLELLTSKW